MTATLLASVAAIGVMCLGWAGLAAAQEKRDRYENARMPDRLLAQLIPNLKGPRLMTETDLGDAAEQQDFDRYGFSFVIDGDFQGDSRRKIAVAGKYDASDPRYSTFIAVIDVSSDNPVLEHLQYVPYHRVSLKLIQNCYRGFPAIWFQLTISSDHAAGIVWSNGRYMGIYRCD